VVDRPDSTGPRICAARAIVEHRVVGPAVPQCLDDSHELLAAGVAVGVADLGVAAIVARGGGEPRGDDVPARPAAAHVIDRRELAR
jgi:hypothetical protein